MKISPRVTKFLANIFDLTSIYWTILIQCIFWAIGKVAVSLMVQNAKVDKNLTKKISDIVGEPFVVFILKVDMVNAFCDEKRNVYITSGMIKHLKLNESEQIAIVLHEVGHAHEKIGFLLRDIADVSGNHMGLILARHIMKYEPEMGVMLYFMTSFLISTVTSLPISRFYEYAADSYAAKQGYGKSLASAFRKLIKYINAESKKSGGSDDNEPDPTKTDSIAVKAFSAFLELMSTHPNTYKRIKNAIEKDVKRTSKSSDLKTTSMNMIKDAGVDVESSHLAKAISAVKISLFGGGI